MKKRVDVLLVEKNLAPSRTQAQEYIKQGLVKVGETLVKASNEILEDDADLSVISQSRFVSRGGEKLQGALDHLKISLKDVIVLDVGISTGGFADCALQNGAKTVVGVDVGHDQLHPSLRDNKNVICLEGINARNLKSHPDLAAHIPDQGFKAIVIDVSFISLTLILPEVVSLLHPEGKLIALVKPQFEVGPQGLGKGGVVKDPQLYPQVQSKVSEKCLELGLKLRDYFSSPIQGKDGNKEFFIYASK